MATDTLILVDTGADSTTLPIQLASLLGLTPVDLEVAPMMAVGGTIKVWQPRADPQMEIDIGGAWYELPSIIFADNTPAILGRDVLFANFKLCMEDGETELLPLD